MAVELLQRVGLSKYEAEAYYVLLLQGPLTGYELGKRSGVPLSKSYEVLERLARRGLAFVQPGEPARYIADRVERFLEQTRSDQASVLSALSAALADAAPADASDEFWVARGRQNILARARALIDNARDLVVLGVWSDDDAGLDDALDRAAARGCRVERLGRSRVPARRDCWHCWWTIGRRWWGRSARPPGVRPWSAATRPWC